ncbi:MAG: hypothetical protein IH946_12160, partial [Bacteroidetes bacterium]|nr:hypothetical protein [Bacteroidota bacterium]
MKVDASEGSDDLKKDIDHKVTILENLPSIDQHYYYFNEYNEKFLMISKWHNATADLLYFYTMPPEEPIGSYSSTHYYLNYSGQVIMIKKYSYYDGGESMNEYFYFYNEKIFLYETESTNGEEKKITHSEKISELTEEHGIRVYLNKSEYFEFED